jgi:hypothetical protein
LGAAVHLLPIVFTLVFAAIGGGLAVTRFGYYAPLYVVGAALGLIGSSLLYVTDIHTKDSTIYGATVLVGIGSGLYIQLGFSVAQAKVPPEYIAAATGFISLGQLLGPVISLTVAGTVFVTSAVSGLKDLLPNIPEATIKNAIGGTAGDLFSSLDENTRAEALAVIVHSISKVYILTITAGAVGFIAAIHLKHEKVLLQPAAAA